MKAGWIVVVAVVAGAGGCVGEWRVARLADEFAGDLKRGRIEEADADAKRVREAAVDAFGPASAEAVTRELEIADAWSRAGQHQRALAIAETTLTDVEKDHGRGDERTTAALGGLASAQLLAHRWKDAEATVDRIAAACRTAAEGGTTFLEANGACRVRMRFEIPRLYLGAGAYRKWAAALLLAESDLSEEPNRRSGVAALAALGRGYAEYGAYAEARWYLQRCVDESRGRYESPDAAAPAVWATDSGDVDVAVVDSAHSFASESPRCLEDLIHVQRKLGNNGESDRLAAWQQELWSRGPDLEAAVLRKLGVAKKAWSDGFLVSADANNLAYYDAGKGRDGDAIAAFREALLWMARARSQQAGDDGAYAAWLEIDELLGLARACERTERFDEAATAAGRAAELSATNLPPGHAWRLDALELLARATAQTRPSEAEGRWREYASVALSVRGPDHVDYASALSGLADDLNTNGRSREAASVRLRANAIRSAATRRMMTLRDLPLPPSLLSPPSPAN